MNDAIAGRLALGQHLAHEAGRLALAAFRNPALRVDSKGPGDVVSEADLAIEKMVRAAVLDAYPEDGVIGEEFGGAASADGFTWLIDPVDGTVNFARKLSYFCISIALLKDGGPIAAWVLDPVLDELFSADAEGNAFLNGAPMRCASPSDFAEAVVGLGFSPRHQNDLGGIIVARLFEAGAENRRLGAGALSLAHVAAGRLDAYVEPHMNAWDAVGGLYIASCAGAVIIDYVSMDGLRHGAPAYAAAPVISDQLLGLLPAPFSGSPLLRQK